MDKIPEYEEAFYQFRDKLRQAMLNEEVDMTFVEQSDRPYYCRININVCGTILSMTLADKFICYHDKILNNLFTEGTLEFNQIQAIAKKHVPLLTDEDIKQIQFHQQEIEKIKSGQHINHKS